MNRESWRLSLAGAAVLLASLAPSLVATNAAALSCAPFSTFQSLSSSSLATLQVKLTYVGVSNAAFPSIAITAFGNTFDLTQFSPCQQIVGGYFNDLSLNVTFASPAELQTLINNVGTLSAVTAGGVVANPYLSFSLSITQPSNLAFEAVIDQPTATALMTQVAASLTNETATSKSLAAFGCNAGILPPGMPTDITSQVKVSLSGLRLRRDTGLYVGNLTVTNNSAGTLTAPVSVAVGFTGSSSVRLAAPDGTTCAVSPGGRGFLNLTSLPAQGSNVTMPVQFTNPDAEPITITTQVLAGPGSR
jgi:hypothetical protein